jgi:peptide/nickel transport system substrate-binding protein
MKKTILIIVMLVCSLFFITNAEALEDKASASNGNDRIVRASGGAPGGSDWGYPSPFGFYPRGPGYVRMSMIFDTLTWKDENGIIPCLADGWNVSDDGMTWTFCLNKDAKWHDSEPFTASDVKFTFDYMKEQEGAFTWFDAIGYIENVEIINDHKVVIELNKPMASFIVDIAGNVPILPEHVWKDVSDPATFQGDAAVMGTGPFKLVKYDKAQEYYQYEANYDYYNGKLLVDQFISMPVSNTALALTAGEIDEASFWGSEIDAVTGFEGTDFSTIIGPSFWVLQIIFNCEKYPTNSKEFRQAVAYGIDRNEIIEQVLHGGGEAANTGIMHPDSVWYNPDCPDYEYDPDQANESLDSLGFTEKIDGIRQYPNDAEQSGDLEFTLYVEGTYTREAEIIQEQLEKIGIRIIIQTNPWSTIDSYLREANFEMAINGHGGIANPQNMNIPDWPASTYHNDEYTSLFKEQEITMDFDVRKGLVDDIQDIVAEDLPVYTLYHPYMWVVYDPDVLDTWFYTRDGISTGIPLEYNKLIFLARYGDATADGKINMQDVTKIERIILEYDDTTDTADGKRDGVINMLDVTWVELMILGRTPARCD